MCLVSQTELKHSRTCLLGDMLKVMTIESYSTTQTTPSLLTAYCCPGKTALSVLWSLEKKQKTAESGL